MLTDYGEKGASYPAEGAIRAKRYVEELQDRSWAECQGHDGSVEMSSITAGLQHLM